MTRLTRALSIGLATLSAAGIAVAIPSPAHAEITCDSRIEWYQNRYEVVATQVVTCNQTAYQIVAAIALTTPVYAENSEGCVVAKTCTATTYTSNRSGLEQYCAGTGGSYQYQAGNPALSSRPLPRRSSCITA